VKRAKTELPGDDGNTAASARGRVHNGTRSSLKRKHDDEEDDVDDDADEDLDDADDDLDDADEVDDSNADEGTLGATAVVTEVAESEYEQPL
jgi:hypothetical protein